MLGTEDRARGIAVVIVLAAGLATTPALLLALDMAVGH